MKVIRLSIPFILSFMFLVMFFYIVKVYSKVSATPILHTIQGTITVNTLQDELNSDGDCSLREAITAANENSPVDACMAGNPVTTDTVTFDTAGTILLASQLGVTAGGQLEIDGVNVITISGGETTRIWWVEYGSNFTVKNMAIVDGFAASGAGIFNNGGNIVIDDCELSNNIAEGGAGGAIYNSNGTLVLSNSTFSGNSSMDFGGGAIFNEYGTLIVSNSELLGNSAFNGGGIRNDGGTITVTHSTLAGNSGQVGGAIFNMGTVNITNSTLSGNYVEQTGAAIYSWFNVTLSNSTLYDNTAGFGSAISSSYITLTITNSIVADSFDTLNCSGPIADGGHNISSDDTCGFDPANESLPNTEPILGPLQDNGGPTWTHALLIGSPAIDSGDDQNCPGTDQRGVSRPKDGDNNGTAVCDIGSFELENDLWPPSIVNLSGLAQGLVTQSYPFSATVEPLTTTLPIEYIWDASDQSQVIHTGGLTDTIDFTWDAPGQKTITITASNTAGSVMDTHVITIADIPISGLAAFNDSPTMLGETTSLSATIQEGTNLVFAWEFGDGEMGDGQFVTHLYPAVGTYTATVTATNSAGSDFVETQVVIEDVPILGLVAVNDSPSVLGEMTTLSATIQAGSNVFYDWDFGDGEAGSGLIITHVYPSVGTYTAAVTATNSTGFSTADTQVIIQDIPISGLVALSDSPTLLGESTSLSATIQAGSNVAYAWDFGDGVSGAGMVTSHIYPSIGIFTATVTATNSSNAQTGTTQISIIGSIYQFHLPLIVRTGGSSRDSIPTNPYSGMYDGLMILRMDKKGFTIVLTPRVT